jgi:hypothetical protein
MMTMKSGTTFFLRLGALLLCLATPQLAAAQDPAKPADPAPAPDPDKVTLNFFKGTEVGGLVDGYYLYNSTKTAPMFHAFDASHNNFDVSMAELWLAKAPTTDSPVGYKVRLNFGHATSVFTPASDGDYKYIEEAYGSYMVPAGKGLQIDFGKFVTNAGAEVIEAKDDWNYSRSLLFQNAIPYFHTGVRLTYSPNDKVTVMGGIVNGWNNTIDQNTGKSVMLSVTLKPTAALSVVENYIGGPEQANDNSDWRNLSDTVVSYTVNPMVSLMANYDYGRDTVASVSQTWQGIAGYAKIQATKMVALVPRVEWYQDKNGFMTGTVQNLKDATITLEIKPADNFMWRIEYRGDFSDKTPFIDSVAKPQSSQNMLILGFLYSFSSKS